MEIKLFEAADKKKSFTFSSLPEKISGSLGTKYQTYDIISQGAVKVPKGTEVAEISWDAVFFGPDRKNLAVVKAESYQKPDKCIKQLREWQEKGTVAVFPGRDCGCDKGNRAIQLPRYSYKRNE